MAMAATDEGPIDAAAIEVARAPIDEVAAVEQATEEEWVVHDALTQITAVEKPTDEEGIAEETKVKSLQYKIQLRKKL